PPAPTLIATGSAEAGMQPLERAHEIGPLLEHRTERVVLQLLHARRRVHDRELPDVEFGRHLAPGERHRHRRAGQGPGAVGRDEQAPVAVLYVIEIHLAVPLLDLTCYRGD